jgi:hypothetical protein
MDPITSTIVAALSVMGSEFVKSSVKDAYDGLKTVIRRKWGEGGSLAKAIEELQANPNSKGQALVLEEKVSETNAAKDADVMQAVSSLLAQLKEAGIAVQAGGDIYIGNEIINSERAHIGPEESR